MADFINQPELKEANIRAYASINENVLFVSIIVPSDATGIVMLDINGTGTYYDLTGNDNEGIYYVAILPKGTYNLTVAYSGDNYYDYDDVSIDVDIVHDLDTNNETIYISPNATIELSIADGKILAELTDGDGAPLANKLLAVTLNGAPMLGAQTDANGIYSLPVEGNATVIVSCTDNNRITVSSSITVINNSETVIVEKNNTVIEYVNQTVYVPVVSNSSFDIVGDENGINAVLLDEDGKPISGAVVELDVNGVKTNMSTDEKGAIAIPTDKNGTIIMTYTDKNGAKLIYTTKVITQTEIIYQNQTIEVPVYINVTPNRTSTRIIYSNMSTVAVNSAIDGRIGEYFKVQLVDSNGKALANKTVSIGFNGKVYTRTTNETGEAELQINLGYEGGYTFAIAFLGDDDYNGSFEVAIIKVSKQSAKLTTSAKTYKASAKTKALSATFKSSNGNAITGKKISFTVNGKTYSATTNDKGVATVKVSLSKKGTYSFTAKFAGDSTYKATTLVQSLL